MYKSLPTVPSSVSSMVVSLSSYALFCVRVSSVINLFILISYLYSRPTISLHVRFGCLPFLFPVSSLPFCLPSLSVSRLFTSGLAAFRFCFPSFLSFVFTLPLAITMSVSCPYFSHSYSTRSCLTSSLLGPRL